MRLGVFGGSFDPPHLGHLVVAEEARQALGLDRVLFVPAPRPPHKAGAVLTPALERLAMVRAAVAGRPGFEACGLEVDRPGPSYTVDTLDALRTLHPGAELFCLVGSDTAVQLDTWHEPERLFSAAAFVALLRPGWPAARIETWLRAQPAGRRPRLEVVEVPGLDISSSDLRQRVAEGRSIRYLVPDPVRDLIAQRGLYGAGGGRADAPCAGTAPTAAELQAAVRGQLSAARAAHSERVAETAAALAARHGLDAGQARVAGLLHDYFREVPAADIVAMARSCGAVPADTPDDALVPAVLHGPVAARVLPPRWPGVPGNVWRAIDRHTTGDPAMTPFDCCLFVGDLVEPAHRWLGVEELRRLAEADLWAATLEAMNRGLRHLLEGGRPIDARTVVARNAVLGRAGARRPPAVAVDPRVGPA